jgi:hypothetical protein
MAWLRKMAHDSVALSAEKLTKANPNGQMIAATS